MYLHFYLHTYKKIKQSSVYQRHSLYVLGLYQPQYINRKCFEIVSSNGVIRSVSPTLPETWITSIFLEFLTIVFDATKLTKVNQ